MGGTRRQGGAWRGRRGAAVAVLVLALVPGTASAHDDEVDGHADTAAVVGDLAAGEVPASTAFDPDAVPDVLAPLAGRLAAAAAAADCDDQALALVQDNVPWVAGNVTIDPDGLGANAIELDAQGQDFCLLSSSDLGSFPLDQFDRIVLAGAQNQGYYDNLFPAADGDGRAVHPDLEAWVAAGGTLIANLTDGASGPGNGGTWAGRSFVGGLVQTPSYQQDNDIVDADHPVVSGDLPCLSLNCGRVVDLEFFQRLDLDDWGYASHGHFSGVAPATELLTDGIGPVLLEYEHGSGSVLASMITTEYRYLGGFGSYLDNRELLANILSYQYTPDCTDDRDCDGIPDDVEDEIGTDPTSSDTDGDGLLDPWEVDQSVEGAGFRTSYPDGADLGITQDEVFGPYGDACIFPDENLRVVDQLSCFNQPPDPLHVDVYLEIDWQDCQVDDCPEVVGLKVDPIHHAPNLPGVGYTVNTFRDAPIDNPDGTDGVNLNIVIDERIAHSVNCDIDESEQRDDYFGTPQQRADANWDRIEDVRREAVRYVWSGHSTFSEGGCPNPNPVAFGATGFGLRNMEAYDFSPFGDVNVAGRDILLTLGPLWSCPGIVASRGRNPGPCYNATEIVGGGLFGGQPTPIYRPGIFPSEIDTPAGEIKAPYPMARMLGLTEQQGMVQMWERTLTHLLGHSLGVSSETAVGNRVDITGSGLPGDKAPRAGTPYLTDWSKLQFAPGGLGIDTLREPDPDYVGLAQGDADGDGTPEGEDNCPGIPNEDQENGDIDEFGDACDGDTDGDGLIEGDDEGFAPRAIGRAAAPAAALAPVAAAGVEFDPFPGDTDNDGDPNATDPDDDDDGVDDTSDNCPTIVNPGQDDGDGDGTGDACDPDDDDDGFVDAAEEYGGSDPRDPASTWELLGWQDTCTDGTDNDLDGTSDGADLGCTDRDGDTNPDLVDNCPDLATTSWYDTDQDGIGDACDTTPDGDGPGSVWVADGDGLFRVDPETGVAEAVDDGPWTAVAVAVDADRGRVWTYGGGVLRALDDAGAEVVRATLPVTSTNDQKVALEVGLAGDVWVSVKDRVVRVAADGTVLATRTLGEDVVAMALDPATERVWVAQKRSVVRLDGDLAIDRRVAAAAKTVDLAVGPTGDLWVALADRVVVLDRAGAQRLSVPLAKAPERIVVAEGLAWVAVRDDVVVLDARIGEVARLVDIVPGQSGPKVVDLAVDGDGVWIADNARFRRAGPDGTLGATLTVPTVDTGATIRDLAVLPGGGVAPADASLGVLVLSPSDGGVVAEATVRVSGITSRPVDVTVAGTPAAVDPDGAFRATVDLPDEGRNTLVVRATGPDGETASTVLTVVRDTVAPDGPVVDRVLRESVNIVRLEGRAEPGATVEVRNTTIAETDFTTTVVVADDGTFTASLPAATGNVLAVEATDAAGNTSATTEVLAP